MKKSKQARAREFSQSERKKIIERDRGQCIFCEMGYKPDPEENWLASEIKSIMHYIPRSKNGLGIEQNGAIGCEYHHHMLDNGPEGNREEMMILFERYLRNYYPEWNKEKLIYSKWR